MKWKNKKKKKDTKLSNDRSVEKASENISWSVITYGPIWCDYDYARLRHYKYTQHGVAKPHMSFDKFISQKMFLIQRQTNEPMKPHNRKWPTQNGFQMFFFFFFISLPVWKQWWVTVMMTMSGYSTELLHNVQQQQQNPIRFNRFWYI